MKHSKAFSRSCAAGLLLLSSTGVNADNWQDASGLLGALGIDPNEKSFMKNNNLKFGGWTEASVSANANATSNGYNGPITFQDKDGQFQLNQFNLYLQKAINVSGDSFDWGGRVDVMYGSDAIFTQAYGNGPLSVAGVAQQRGDWDLHLLGDQTYNLAIPNAYAEFNLPIGNGIDVKAGHFYTPIGYEVVTSPDNFLVTKPYTMQYGEPFTHTGAYGTYAFNSNWSAFAGAVTGSGTGGWDGNFNRNNGNWDFLGGATWTSDDAGTSLNASGTIGPTAENNSNNWGIYSIVGKHNLNDKTHLVLQHDHGFAQGVLVNGEAKTVEWYGINSYIFYDINDKLSAGLRGEWFRDQDGYRVANAGRCFAAGNNGYNAAGATCTVGSMSGGPGPNTYYALTAGLSYKPTKWLNLRPNMRLDYADKNAFGFGSDGLAVQKTQFLFSADAVITF